MTQSSNPVKPEAFRYQRRIQFSETDMAGIVHFSHFYRYMEEAEHAFLRSLGMKVFMEHNAATMTWPRLAASCDFASPARFDELLDVDVSVAAMARKTVTYSFSMSIEGRKVADGRIVVACCDMPETGRMKAIEIPTEIRTKLEPFCLPQ